jgi:hypothetical protein
MEASFVWAVSMNILMECQADQGKKPVCCPLMQNAARDAGAANFVGFNQGVQTRKVHALFGGKDHFFEHTGTAGRRLHSTGGPVELADVTNGLCFSFAIMWLSLMKSWSSVNFTPDTQEQIPEYQKEVLHSRVSKSLMKSWSSKIIHGFPIKRNIKEVLPDTLFLAAASNSLSLNQKKLFDAAIVDLLSFTRITTSNTTSTSPCTVCNYSCEKICQEQIIQ